MSDGEVFLPTVEVILPEPGGVVSSSTGIALEETISTPEVPNVVSVWESLQTDDLDPQLAGGRIGLHYSGGRICTTQLGYDGRVYGVVLDPALGEGLIEVPLPSDGLANWGMVFLNAHYVHLTRQEGTNSWFLDSFNLVGVYESTLDITAFMTGKGAAITTRTDGGTDYVYVATWGSSDGTDSPQLRRFAVDSGTGAITRSAGGDLTTSGRQWDARPSGGARLTGVVHAVGSMNSDGVAYWYFGVENGVGDDMVRAFEASTGAYTANREFTTSLGSSGEGLATDGIRLWSLPRIEGATQAEVTNMVEVTRHSTWDWHTALKEWYVSVAWYSAQGNTHRGLSAFIQSLPRRSFLDVSVNWPSSGQDYLPDGEPDTDHMFLNAEVLMHKGVVVDEEPAESPPTHGNPYKQGTLARTLGDNGYASTDTYHLDGYSTATPHDGPTGTITRPIYFSTDDGDVTYWKGDPPSGKASYGFYADTSGKLLVPKMEVYVGTPEDGQVFFDNVLGHFWGYDGGQWLQLDNAEVPDPVFMGAKALMLAPQSITVAAGVTAIKFEHADDYDTDAIHAPSDNQGRRFIIPKTGYWRINAQIRHNGTSSANHFHLHVQRTRDVTDTILFGSTYFTYFRAAAHTDYGTVALTGTAHFVEGDYFQLIANSPDQTLIFGPTAPGSDENSYTWLETRFEGV